MMAVSKERPVPLQWRFADQAAEPALIKNGIFSELHLPHKYSSLPGRDQPPVQNSNMHHQGRFLSVLNR